MRPCGNSTKLKVLVEQLFSKASRWLTIANKQSFNYLLGIETTKNVAFSPVFIDLRVLVDPVSRQRLIRSNWTNHSLGPNISNVVKRCHLEQIIPFELLKSFLLPKILNSLDICQLTLLCLKIRFLIFGIHLETIESVKTVFHVRDETLRVLSHFVLEHEDLLGKFIPIFVLKGFTPVYLFLFLLITFNQCTFGKDLPGK